MKNTRKGFTLIELVIVVAIIGILALMIIPNFGAVTGNAKAKTFVANAKAIQTAVGEYTMAKNGEVPTKADDLTSATNGGPFIDNWPATPKDAQYWIGDGTGTIKTTDKLDAVKAGEKGKVYAFWKDDKGDFHAFINGVYNINGEIQK